VALLSPSQGSFWFFPVVMHPVNDATKAVNTKTAFFWNNDLKVALIFLPYKLVIQAELLSQNRLNITKPKNRTRHCVINFNLATIGNRSFATDCQPESRTV